MKVTKLITYRLFFVPVMLVVILLGGIWHAPLASATPILPPCNNTFLEQWDWPADLKRSPTGAGPNWGAGLSGFNHDDNSYVIFGQAGTTTSTPKRNVFTLVLGASQLYLYNAGGSPKITSGAGGLTTKFKATITSEPRQQVGPGYYVWPSGNPDVDTSTAATTFGDVNLATDADCVAVAHNVAYDSSWTWNRFVANMDFKAGADAAASCTTLDVACKIKQAFGFVEDTYTALTQAVLQGIASLFVPDTSQISADFDSFNTFMSNKLGFLTYPLTFLVDVFNAFGSTSNNWCTTSSCSKDFGTLFGAHWVVNFNLPATVYPTLWTWFKALLSGLTILELVIALKNKYKAVVSK